jgi:nucleotide-binding universal stress UspA family protein
MRVLLAVDGSTSSDQAASLVANLTWPVSTTIKILTAYPGTAETVGSPDMVMPADLINGRDDTMEAAAGGMVAGVATRLAAPDVTVETQISHARAADAILDEAEQFDADLIILGSRGHGALASAVLGSVCLEVVEHSSRPVLVARGDRIDRILFGEDGSRSAAAGVDLICRWSVFHGSKVRVLSVDDNDPQATPWLRGSDQRETDLTDAADELHERQILAQTAASTLRAAGLLSEADVVDGDPGDKLVADAADWGANMIVIGSRDRSALQRWLAGSVTRDVLFHAKCSILVMPDSDRPARQSAGVGVGVGVGVGQ